MLAQKHRRALKVLDQQILGLFNSAPPFKFDTHASLFHSSLFHSISFFSFYSSLLTLSYAAHLHLKQQTATSQRMHQPTPFDAPPTFNAPPLSSLNLGPVEVTLAPTPGLTISIFICVQLCWWKILPQAQCFQFSIEILCASIPCFYFHCALVVCFQLQHIGHTLVSLRRWNISISSLNMR